MVVHEKRVGLLLDSRILEPREDHGRQPLGHDHDYSDTLSGPAAPASARTGTPSSEQWPKALTVDSNTQGFHSKCRELFTCLLA